MSKARTLANLISDNAELADGQISVAEVVGAAPTASPTFTGNIDAGDNVKIRLGDSDDLQIYHTGSASVIQDSGDGSLFLQGESQIVLGSVGNAESYAVFNKDGAVQLRHDNAQKFSTTSTGIDVTGTVANSSGNLTLDANAEMIFDSNGANWRLKDNGTQILHISRPSGQVKFFASVQDSDIVFGGMDGTSPITALTLDMSASGDALFNSDVVMGSTGKLRSNGDDDSYLQFNQANTLRAVIGDSTRMIITPTQTVFNEDSADIDFRVESDSNTHMLFVDAGRDQVAVGTSGNFTSKLTVVGNKTLSAGIPTNQLSVIDESSMAAGVGGAITLWGNYTTAGSDAEGASIEAIKDNATSGNYGFGMKLRTRTHGSTMDERLSLSNSSTVFNENGYDTDFRVESDNNTHMLFVDAQNNRVKIAGTGGSALFNINANVTATDPGFADIRNLQSGQDCRVLIATPANTSGDPYVKFDGGGSNMIVGLNWHGTTSNKLKLGAADRPNQTIKGITVSGLGNTSISSTGYEGTLDSSDNGVTGHTLSVAGTHVMQRDANSTGAETMIVNNIHSSGAAIGMLQYRTRNSVEGSLNGNSSGLVITNASDYRKKENITDATGCLTKITGLRPVTYTHRSEYDTDTTTVHTGFIAHEVSDHMPSIVEGAKDAVDDEGNAVLQSVAYSDQEIITNLVGAIKELEARIVALESA